VPPLEFTNAIVFIALTHVPTSPRSHTRKRQRHHVITDSDESHGGALGVEAVSGTKRDDVATLKRGAVTTSQTKETDLDRDLEGQHSAAPPDGEPMKRFTIDVPVSLHRRIKAACAERGLKTSTVLRDLLEREFPETSGQFRLPL